MVTMPRRWPPDAELLSAVAQVVDLLHLPGAEDGEQRAHPARHAVGRAWRVDGEVEQLGRRTIVGFRGLERRDIGEDEARRAADNARVAERLEADALGGLHLYVAKHAAARAHGVEAHRRDAHALANLDCLTIERQ